MKAYNKLNASMADHVFHTALTDGTMCVDIVRLFLYHFSSEIAKKAVWTHVQREQIPEECLAEFDEYHVRLVIEQ